jgi:DNA-binding response OmpR family regulator
VKRILLVEDSRDQLDLLSLALMRQGWQVEVASRASEAMEQLGARHFDLVISHLGLPDRQATHMLQDARASGWLESTAVVIITGQAHPENPDAFPVLHKPVDIDALVRQVASILGEAGAPPAGEAAEGRIELVLYYTPPWPSSEKARRNLEKILAAYPEEAVRLTLRDLAEHPDLAEADAVVFSPTLIKKSPGAPVWMLGDLSDAAAVTDMLLSAGVTPRA